MCVTRQFDGVDLRLFNKNKETSKTLLLKSSVKEKKRMTCLCASNHLLSDFYLLLCVSSTFCNRIVELAFTD